MLTSLSTKFKHISINLTSFTGIPNSTYNAILRTESQAFLKSLNNYSSVSLYSPFSPLPDQLYHPFYKQYSNRFLPLMWQFFLVTSRTNKFVDLGTSCINCCLDYFWMNLINTRWLASFQLFCDNFKPERAKFRYQWLSIYALLSA
jgi:hypothetical protein